jgi:hypothetical protein
LSLAVAALAAFAVFAGIASATTLTSPKGTTYTGSGAGEAEGSIYLTSPFGFGTITCNKATYSGKVEFHGLNVTAGGKVASLAFTECTGGEPTSPVISPGTLEVHSTSTAGNGTVTSKSAEVIVHKTLLGTCKFTTASTGTDLGTLTGSNITKGNATVHVSGTIPGTCGSSVLEGSIKITSPITLEVD